MRISPNSEVASPLEVQGRTAVSEKDMGQDNLSLVTTDTLDSELQQTPDTRADKVAEATALLSDSTYPPLVLIRKISNLLAIHINNDSTKSAQ